MARGLTYKDAGVDVGLKQRLVPLIGSLAQPTMKPGVLGGVGGFGALIDLGRASRGMRAPVIVAGTDGVGTKLKIAAALGRHGSVGIDCVAMCANDIICHGARPLFFLDYIGVGKLEPRVVRELVKGVARGCVEAGMALVGGETAQLAGLYPPGEYDLVGFAVGIVERSRIPTPRKVRAGDIVIGIASSGLHSNGYSLARKVLLEQAKLRLDARIAELGCALGEELLRPTRIYVKLAMALFERFTIKGLANITGGGIVENLPRVLPPGLGAVIRRGSWPMPAIFGLIAKIGKISQAEMDRTFNNGLGMTAIVPAAQAQDVTNFIRRRHQEAWVVGQIERSKRILRFI